MKPGDPAADLVYLQHIRDAAEVIAGYLHGVDEPAFKANRLVQDGVIRQLQKLSARRPSASPPSFVSSTQISPGRT